MPRRQKGGFFDTLSNWGSNLWNKTKSATSSLTSPSYQQPSTSYQQPSPSYQQPSTYGGKSRKHRRMRGGFKDNTPTTGIASNAASFSGQTAKPHNLVGGRTRKHHKKNRRHRKH